MPFTAQDAQTLKNHLNQIFDLAHSAMNDRDRFQIRRYIDAGEYSLALDDMADIVLELEKPVPIELRSLFAAAAKKMNIKPGTGLSGVDDLLKPGHTTQ